MLLKNISLQGNAVLFRQEYPSIYLGNNKKINDFMSGYLSREILLEIYSNLFNFFQNFQPQYFHQGFQIITLDDNWQKFIQANKRDFRFNKQNNQLIYLQKEMTGLQKDTFKNYFYNAKDRQVFDTIEQGLSSPDLKKIGYRLKDLEPNVADFLTKIFTEDNFFRVVVDYFGATGTIVAENQQFKEFFSEQSNQVYKYFSYSLCGIPKYSAEQIQKYFNQKKLSLINYLFLLIALNVVKNRKEKYQFYNSRLYMINGQIRNSSAEIEQIIELTANKNFVRYIAPAFLSQPEPILLRQLAAKSIAVGGGKGGVGKSLTSVNLALNYSMLGYRTAIVDLDPTSNIAIILDLRSPENFYHNKSSEISQLNDLAENTLSVGENLDILFSKQKLAAGDSIRLLNKLYINYLAKLNQDYDILIMDLPAGNHLDDNLVFSPFIDNFLLVTTNEPTAHKSCGGYLKSLLEIDAQKKVFIWHNKIDPNYPQADFIAAYNRISPDEEKLDPTLAVTNLGYIPQTDYLKINMDNPDPQEIALNLLTDTLKTIATEDNSLNQNLETTLNILNDQERRKKSIKTIKQIIEQLIQDQQLVNKYTNNLKLLVSYYTLLLLANNKSIVRKINEFIPVYNTKIVHRDKHRQIMELLAKQSREKELADILLKVFNFQLEKLKFDESVLPNRNQRMAIVVDFCMEVLYSGMGMLSPLGKRVAAQQFRDQAQELLEAIGFSE